ncbi:SGNH/GDSL hydrolase family protein [Phocaeicola sp.]|uniref:SGNH/GDSL hydrolase family protein n=1 Tax=Phocaeicola sp. TaxID=2773926 RepID=UPI003A91540A
MKNKLLYTFLFTFLVVVGLCAMYFLPSASFCGQPLRKVDLLSDIRIKKEMTEPVDSDTLVLPLPVKPVFVDTCKSGMVCIEEYTDSMGYGMTRFYEALEKVESLGRPVRIAYFGDSFIEADILTGDLREMLQKRFGGCGVGYVPITTKIAGFRPTVHHSFGGWSSHSITDSTYFDRSRQDISNHYFAPSQGAYVMLKGEKRFLSRIDTCDVSTCYFLTLDSLRLTVSVNGREPQQFLVDGKEELQAVSVNGRIGSVRWNVEKLDSTALFYAVTMDPYRGVVVDNFSTRGSSGQQLGNIPMSILRQYNRLRTYDLIVLQYGLNVASDQVMNYTYYKDAMKPVVERLKTAFPEASFLIVSVGDRENKDENGELRTMPGVKRLIRYQQALAAETHVAFWNMFEAMGGEGSMVDMVNHKPQMANYDYTHINFRGGKHIAGLLFETLMYGKEQYEKRKAYEME